MLDTSQDFLLSVHMSLSDISFSDVDGIFALFLEDFNFTDDLFHAKFTVQQDTKFFSCVKKDFLCRMLARSCLRTSSQRQKFCAQIIFVVLPKKFLLLFLGSSLSQRRIFKQRLFYWIIGEAEFGKFSTSGTVKLSLPEVPAEDLFLRKSRKVPTFPLHAFFSLDKVFCLTDGLCSLSK